MLYLITNWSFIAEGALNAKLEAQFNLLNNSRTYRSDAYIQ